MMSDRYVRYSEKEKGYGKNEKVPSGDPSYLRNQRL